MKTSTTTLIQEDMTDGQDQKAVLAYRVGQLEKTTALGLKEIKDELHDLRNHYVTSKELKDAKDAEDVKHVEQDGRIASLEAWNEYAVKIVLGIILTAIIGLVIVNPTIGG